VRLFGPRRREVERAREAASFPVKAPCLIEGGASSQARLFKANIGHRALKYHAILFAIVVADTPEEAGELLLRWSKGSVDMHAMIKSGEFILEEIHTGLKGVY